MRYIILILLLNGIIIAGCSAQKEMQLGVKLEESFSLTLQESVRFIDDDTGFRVTVISIQESRCPADVNCITGGKATVLAEVENQPEHITFCTGADCREAAQEFNSFTVEQNNKCYTIVLEDVSPYPQEGNEMMEKQAIFKIKQATK